MKIWQFYSHNQSSFDYVTLLLSLKTLSYRYIKLMSSNNLIVLKWVPNDFRKMTRKSQISQTTQKSKLSYNNLKFIQNGKIISKRFIGVINIEERLGS